MAPEILSGKSYQGEEVDLFASAVILFILRAGHLPFEHALSTELNYRHFASNPNRPDLFWQSHSAGKEKGYFSDDFKNLITLMLDRYPHQRLSMADVGVHPWLSGPVATN